MGRRTKRSSYTVPRRLRDAHIARPPYFCKGCGSDFARGLDLDSGLPVPIEGIEEEVCVTWICSACGYSSYYAKWLGNPTIAWKPRPRS